MRRLDLSIYDDVMLEKVTSALSSKTRREILKLVSSGSYNIVEIAAKMKLPVSTAAFHIKSLAESELIQITIKKENKGVSKYISKKMDAFSVDFSTPTKTEFITSNIEIPIGSYFFAKAEKTCGLADDMSIIGEQDTETSFFLPERLGAGIIWFSAGRLDYHVPNFHFKGKTLHSVSVSMEICSEAPNFRIDYKSNISFYLNNIKLCTWTSPGDLGGRRGNLNPAYWSNNATQYGIMKRIYVDETGVYLDAERVAGTKLSKFALNEGSFFDFSLGVDDDAEFKGGLNLFGKHFGDFDQDILFVFEYK